ncbi:hypothetical protein ACGFIE_00595 [Micromonospora sp. NPDC049275]|uniref:hypothetical protein n=1 Tax=Micromonospora sp. NPDC049275 TaxID=3364268 RepID=UPI00371658E0
MKAVRRATVLTAALTAVEALADEEGFDAYPTLLGLFDSTSLTGAGRLDTAVVPIDTQVWSEHAMPGTSLTLPYWVGLRAITDTLSTAKAGDLRAWSRAQPGPLLAMAFLGEGLDTSESGRHAAVALGIPAADDGIPVRALTACDVDGRHYQILRYRSAVATTSVMLNDPPAQITGSGIPADLRRLLSTANA